MNCQEIHRHIEDFHYGELDEKTTSHVRTHLRSCAECTRALEALDAEDNIYQAYSDELNRHLNVSPEMWGRIRNGLDAPESRRVGRLLSDRLADFSSRLFPGSSVLRQAAFAVVIVVISVGATLMAVHYYRAQNAGFADGRAVGVPEPLKRVGTQNSLEDAILTIRLAERDYNNAIDVLSRIVDRRKSSLDPRLVAEVERNLKTIDESIAATRAAYHANLSDPDLAHYMLTAYEKKVELLLELAS